jgi:hypothetical protein
MNTADQIIAQLKAVSDRNGGQPPSLRSFFQETGLNQRDLHRAGWSTYGALLKSQGFQPGGVKRGYTDEEIFRPLAELALRLGHFPTQSEREVERHRHSAFPSTEAYIRRGRGSLLEHALRDWCEATNSFPDLVPSLNCSSASSALVLWAPRWRPDQKDVAAREEAASTGLNNFLARSGCFASAELRRVPTLEASAVSARSRRAEDSRFKVVGIEVRELGPVVKLLSSAALLEGGTEVVLRVTEYSPASGAQLREFTVHWQNGGAGVIKGVASLPVDMQAALSAALQPSSAAR